MKVAYIEGNAGISGNMFLGALLSLGYPLDILKKELLKLKIAFPELTCKTTVKQGIAAYHFEVSSFHEHHHRHLSDIVNVISQSGIDPDVIHNALRCFTTLAEVEAKIHGTTVDEVHFHEVGAIDAIIDIVGSCLGIKFLNIDKLYISSLRVGFGSVKCAHGEIPIPAPATLELLTGFSVFGGELMGEWTTPTGAAIVKTFASNINSLPKMKIKQVGYGAGTSDRAIPNVLRLFLGDEESFQITEERLTIIETNIDDMNPEIYGYLGERLLKAGAKDFFLTPVIMKKGRPGTLITVLVSDDQLDEVETIILTETTSLGIRKYSTVRNCLEREQMEVAVGAHKVRVKLGIKNGKIIKYAPEYEDCRMVADADCRFLKDVYEEALLAAITKMKI